MTIEFLLVLLAVVGGLFGAAYLYCAIFEFVDRWKKKEPWGANIAEHPRTTELRRMTRELQKGRLPPMAPWDRYGMTTGLYDYDAPVGPPPGHERRPPLPKARRMMD